MTTWHVTPEYINTQWTEEQFLLLFRMRNKRIRHESGKTRPGKSNMSGDDFLAACGVVPQKVN